MAEIEKHPTHSNFRPEDITTDEVVGEYEFQSDYSDGESWGSEYEGILGKL